MYSRSRSEAYIEMSMEATVKELAAAKLPTMNGSAIILQFFVLGVMWFLTRDGWGLCAGAEEDLQSGFIQQLELCKKGLQVSRETNR